MGKKEQWLDGQEKRVAHIAIGLIVAVTCLYLIFPRETELVIRLIMLLMCIGYYVLSFITK